MKEYDKHFFIYENCMISFFCQPGMSVKKFDSLKISIKLKEKLNEDFTNDIEKNIYFFLSFFQFFFCKD